MTPDAPTALAAATGAGVDAALAPPCSTHVGAVAVPVALGDLGPLGPDEEAR